MEIKRLRSLALKTFKILDYQNQFVMKEIFYVSSHNTHRRHDIFVQNQKTTKHDDKSLRALDPH